MVCFLLLLLLRAHVADLLLYWCCYSCFVVLVVAVQLPLYLLMLFFLFIVLITLVVIAVKYKLLLLLFVDTLVVLLYHNGELRTQKLKSHLMRTQSSKVLPLKPGVGQCIAMHATRTARDFFLANFYPSGPFICIFSQTPPCLSCVSCG